MEKGLVKLKCPENSDPITKKPYPEGHCFQCLQCFEAPRISSGYINLRTPWNQKYWYQNENGMTHKLMSQRNEHNEELVNKGENKRQRQTGIHAFVVLKKKREIVGDREDDNNSEEGNKDTSSVQIKDKAECVGVWNSIKGGWRRQLGMINQYVLISVGRRYKWCQICALPAIVSEECNGRGVVIEMDAGYSCLPCDYLRKIKGEGIQISLSRFGHCQFEVL